MAGFPPTAGRGVTQVIERCESAKTSGFLDLSHCSLMYIADAIYLVLKGYEITKLSVRQNCLKKFPTKFLDKFPEITIFNMEGNEIAELPEGLEKWTSMRGMNISNNKVSTFPEGIYNMKQLAILDISENQIKEIDADRLYESCPQLMQLNVLGNPLTEEVKGNLINSPKKPQKLIIKWEA